MIEVNINTTLTNPIKADCLLSNQPAHQEVFNSSFELLIFVWLENKVVTIILPR